MTREELVSAWEHRVRETVAEVGWPLELAEKIVWALELQATRIANRCLDGVCSNYRFNKMHFPDELVTPEDLTP